MKRLILACAAATIGVAAPAFADEDWVIDWEVADRFRLIKMGSEQRRYDSDLQQALKRAKKGQLHQSFTTATYHTHWDARLAKFETGYAHPSTWPLHLRIVGNSTSKVRCTWTVEGKTYTGCTDVRVTVSVGATPVSVRVEQEGKTTVVNGSVAPTDLLVVSLGDSYASGEGVPEVNHIRADSQSVGKPAFWLDRRCHRSLASGPAIAAQKLANDPDYRRSSVTFVPLACSGATITEGLLGPYVGAQKVSSLQAERRLFNTSRDFSTNPMLPPQLDVLAETLCPPQKFVGNTCSVQPRRPDLIFLSIGGNDVNFGPIVRKLVAKCDQDCVDGVKNNIRTDLGNLVKSYAELDRRLREQISGKTVVLGEYPDPTHRDAKTFCSDWDKGSFVPKVATLFGYGITDADAKVAYDEVIVPLSGTMCKAAETNRWHFVDGLIAAASDHGYCTQERWFNRFTDATSAEHKMAGSMHPNVLGHHDGYGIRLFLAALDRLAERAKPPICPGSQDKVAAN
jgi:hypothetical protein